MYQKLHRYKYLFLFLALSLVCVLIYFPAFSVGFLSDDYYALGIFSSEGIRIDFGPEGNIFMPLMLLVTGVLFKIFGLHPLMYHVFIIAIHVLNSLLLALFIERLLKHFNLFQERTFLIACLTAFLFAVNPYHTEAITWIASIGYPLSLSLCLGSMLVFLKWIRQRKFWILLLSAVLFFLAVLAKEVALALPGVLVIMLLAEYRIRYSKPWLSLLPYTGLVALFFLLLIIVYFLVRFYLTGEFIGNYGAQLHLDFTIKGILSTVLVYTAKFYLVYRFLPVLIHDALRFIVHHIYISGGIIACMFIFIYYRRKVWKDWIFKPEVRLSALFFLCFVLTLIPVLNLELSFLSDIQSDRYGYFASLFFTLSAVFVILSLTGGKTIPISIIMLLPIVWFSILTYGENKKWEHSSVISDTFFRSLKERGVEGKELYLINVPDTYKGAYVSRRGIEEGLTVNGICNSCKVHILSYMTIKNDTGAVRCIHDGNCLMIRCTDGSVKMFPGENAFNSPGFFYSASTDGVLRICFEGELPSDAAVCIVKPDGTLFSE